MNKASGHKDDSKIVVFWTRRESVCDGCGERPPPGGLIRLREETAWCLDSASVRVFTGSPPERWISSR